MPLAEAKRAATLPVTSAITASEAPRAVAPAPRGTVLSGAPGLPIGALALTGELSALHDGKPVAFLLRSASLERMQRYLAGAHPGERFRWSAAPKSVAILDPPRQFAECDGETEEPPDRISHCAAR